MTFIVFGEVGSLIFPSFKIFSCKQISNIPVCRPLQVPKHLLFGFPSSPYVPLVNSQGLHQLFLMAYTTSAIHILGRSGTKMAGENLLDLPNEQ